MTRVTVVTGFLGAGKTTLVNRWLADIPRGDIAVIVNEHGDVGVDGELLAARVRALVEITGGCICCRTQAELVRALETLSSSAKRILVETSGAASPAGVLGAIARGGRDGSFALDGVVTVVDAARIDRLAEHDLAYEQLGYADIVVLTRADQCDRARLDHAAGVVAARNGAAWVVESPGVAALDALLDARRADFATPRDVPTSKHDAYESIALVHEGDIDGERFADFVESELERVSGRIFRTKGILSLAGAADRMIVQGVADVIEVTFGEPWADAPRTSRLVIVGFGLDREALTKSFALTIERGAPPQVRPPR